MVLSAVAVDKEMVGRDSDAELIGGVAVVDCWRPLAASREAWAVWGSDLALGDVEKSWLRRFDLAGALVEVPPFSEELADEKEEEVLAKGFVGRRGIARL